MQNNNNAFHLCSETLSHTLFSTVQSTSVLWKMWSGGILGKGFRLNLVCSPQEVVLFGFIHSFFLKYISSSYYMPGTSPLSCLQNSRHLSCSIALHLFCLFPMLCLNPTYSGFYSSPLILFLVERGAVAPQLPYNNPSESVIRHPWGCRIYLLIKPSFSALLYGG